MIFSRIQLFLFLILLAFSVKAKTVYFYTNNLSASVYTVRVFQDKEKVAEISKNQWIKIDVNSNSETTFKFKWGPRRKKLTIDFSDKDVAFIYIYLSPFWSVSEQQIQNAPQLVREDYEKTLKSENHPTTNWSEESLKSKFNTKVNILEGIYESSFSSNYSGNIKLGVVNENGVYKLIYLSGGNNQIWNEGDLKAILFETATPNLYKAKWYSSDKLQQIDSYLNFKEGMFTTTFGDASESLFVKMYPKNSVSNNSTIISSGTGFALHESGYIVTNFHVVDNANNIRIKGINGNFDNSFNAVVISTDHKNDLAILKIVDSLFIGIEDIPYRFNFNEIDVGSSVFAFGYPLRSSMGDEVKLANGIISSNSGFKGDITTYQISVPIQPGNSGGPLFDKSGNLVGVINAVHRNTENVSYAIKASYLNSIIQATNIELTEKLNNNLSNASLSEQVKLIKNYVYIIDIN